MVTKFTNLGFFSLVFYMPKKNEEEEEETFGKLILNLHIVIVSWSGFFLVTNDNKQYCQLKIVIKTFLLTYDGTSDRDR
ncbi:hypothetical protein DERF_015036 [Dermatophagoides farinae]|uniref:Uncharacterized protein n=1 Tax=Dermatophagoides farinae TaxID=6954 RepID=A0A922HQF9_DERFA|nr:hypothetical protein DERF_015036 [Dermatophagoides farinae]